MKILSKNVNFREDAKKNFNLSINSRYLQSYKINQKITVEGLKALQAVKYRVSVFLVKTLSTKR